MALFAITVMEYETTHWSYSTEAPVVPAVQAPHIPEPEPEPVRQPEPEYQPEPDTGYQQQEQTSGGYKPGPNDGLCAKALYDYQAG